MTPVTAEQLAELAKRLRAAANGVGSTKSDLGDFGICDEAANAIGSLVAEVERLRNAMHRIGLMATDTHIAIWARLNGIGEILAEVEARAALPEDPADDR